MSNILINDCIDRFLEELKTINSYVEYMEENFYLKYKKLEFTKELLSKFDFYTEDIEQRKLNQQILKSVQDVITEKIKEYEIELNSLEKIEISSKLNENPMFVDEKVDFLEYMSPTYYDDYKEHIDRITPEELKEEIEKMSGVDNVDYPLENYKDLIEYSSIAHHNSSIDYLEYEYEELLNFQTLYKIFDSENPINIYRQSFILMITAFDATMYDFAKILFENDFFKFISNLDKKGKITFGEISESGNFDMVSEKIITDHLDSIFIHKLLFLLKRFKEELFEVNGQDYFVDLIEMIKRRNIHVHNKGIVDKKYFESGINHNKYDLKLDEYASITDAYYINCSDILEKLMLYLRLSED